MRENIRIDRLRMGDPIRVAGIDLIPLEQVCMEGEEGSAGVWIRADLDPVAVVVVDDRGVWIHDLGRPARTLKSLRAQIPELDERLRRWGVDGQSA